MAHAAPARCRVSETPRLLVVDDNADNLEIAAIMLGERYRVVTCSSAAEAIASLETADPDAIVLDIAMAPVDGMACLRAIRANPRYAKTPAVALTALARDVERQTFLSAGFEAVVTKPIIDPRYLMDVIDGLIGEPAVDAVS